jgi:hypothetical protein
VGFEPRKSHDVTVLADLGVPTTWHQSITLIGRLCATLACADFEAAVVEDMAGQLRRQVEEHADWLKANCERQVHSRGSVCLHAASDRPQLHVSYLGIVLCQSATQFL